MSAVSCATGDAESGFHDSNDEYEDDDEDLDTRDGAVEEGSKRRTKRRRRPRRELTFYEDDSLFPTGENVKNMRL
jgi:hypothetical protein